MCSSTVSVVKKFLVNSKLLGVKFWGSPRATCGFSSYETVSTPNPSAVFQIDSPPPGALLSNPHCGLKAG